MDALIDMNSFGLTHVSSHRQAELNALTSPDLRKLLDVRRILPVTYRDLARTIGLERMKRPE
jgi:hypothetical protein